MSRSRGDSHRIENLEARTLLAGYPVSLGSGTFDSASKVSATPDGGSVVAGLFSGTADFDPTSGKRLLTASGDTDIFVARYSRTGALVWVKQFGSDEGDFESDKVVDTPTLPERAGDFDLGVGLDPATLGEYVTGLSVDSAGNVFLAGSFRGAVDFDPGSRQTIFTSIDGRTYLDSFFLKLDNGGNLAFAKQIGGRFTDVTRSMTLDAAGNIYLTGYFSRSCDFDPSSKVRNLTTLGREDTFIAKYNSLGGLVWAKSHSTEELDRNDRSVGNGIAVDSSGNVYVTGSFAGETDFTPLTRRIRIEPVDETDIFVEKLSSDGTPVWVKTMGGGEFDGGLAIAVGADGSVYTGSYFERTIDVDPGAAVRNVTATPEKLGRKPERPDLLISKFDGNGNFAWARPLGNQGIETLGNLRVDSAGNVYTTGAFYGSIDFDPGRGKAILTSTPPADDVRDANDGDRDDTYDAFLQKLDTNGRYVFATRFGSTSDDYGIDVALDAAQRPIVAGQFRGTFVFPSTTKKLRPIGQSDAFVAIFGTDGEIV